MEDEADDLLPGQRGKSPTPDELAKREALAKSPVGRLGRLRSWITVLVAIAAVAACYFWLIRTQ